MGATAPLGYRLATEPHGGGELRCAELAMGATAPLGYRLATEPHGGGRFAAPSLCGGLDVVAAVGAEAEAE